MFGITCRPSVTHTIITDPTIRSAWSSGPRREHLWRILQVEDPARKVVVIVHEMTDEEREAWQFNPVLMRVTTDESHTIRKYDLLPRVVTSAESAAKNKNR